MGKQKNTELNFLYLDDKYQDKKNINKSKTNSKAKQVKKVNKKRADKMSAPENDYFNFDNEIVIGVTKIPDKNVNQNTKKQNTKVNKQKKSTNNQQNNKSNKNKRNNSKNINTKKNQTNTKKQKRQNRKTIIIKGIIKWTILLSALAASIVFFMMSPLFNIVQIDVVGNEKIQTDTIISLSQITLGDNIYKTSSKQIEQNIKENAYIQEVEIKRKLPNKIMITVKERKTTYMLEYASSYAYINNQGYILDISQEIKEVPIIEGYATKEEEIKPGSRLCDDDLEKLENVLRIVDSANSNGIGNLITRINIQDKQNYTLIMEEAKKIVYLGDASNLSNRMVYLKAILAGEEGIEGEIFVNGDLNKENAFFRKKE